MRVADPRNRGAGDVAGLAVTCLTGQRTKRALHPAVERLRRAGLRPLLPRRPLSPRKA